MRTARKETPEEKLNQQTRTGMRVAFCFPFPSMVQVFYRSVDKGYSGFRIIVWTAHASIVVSFDPWEPGSVRQANRGNRPI